MYGPFHCCILHNILYNTKVFLRAYLQTILSMVRPPNLNTLVLWLLCFKDTLKTPFQNLTQKRSETVVLFRVLTHWNAAQMIKHTARNTLDTDNPRVGKFPSLIHICPVLLISVVFECEQVQTLKMYFLSSLLFLRSQLFWGVSDLCEPKF